MDGLIYTPRRTDFLKDGSIFAQSPVGTSNTAIAPRFPVADTNNRSRFESAPASTYQAPALLAPRPRAVAAQNHTQASWAPLAANSPQLPVSDKDDIAKQIRAKFENLVRASPLPKVVEQLVSPGGSFQHPDWINRLSRDGSRLPNFHAQQTPASVQAASGRALDIKPLIAYPNDGQVAGMELPTSCQVSLETRLCNSVRNQATSHAASHLHSNLLMGQPAAPRDSIAPEPAQLQQPASSSALAQVTASAMPVEQAQTTVPAVQQPSDGQPAPSGLPGAHQPTVLVTVDSALETNDFSPSIGTYQRPQQQQQQQPQQAGASSCAAANDKLAHAEPALHRHTVSNQPEPAGDATQRQASSSMASLSPSLKLDIPGLDDILSSDLLSQSQEQATSQLQLPQQPTGSTQQAVNDWQSVAQQQPDCDRQQEVAQSTAYPAGPDTAGLADEHAVSQAIPQPESPREANVSSSQDMPRQTEPQSPSKAVPGPESARLADDSSVAGESVAAQQQTDPSTSQAAGEAVLNSSPGQAPASGCAKVLGTDQVDVAPGLAQVTANATSDPPVNADALLRGSDDSCTQQHSQAVAKQNASRDRHAEADTLLGETLEHGPSAEQYSVRMQVDKTKPAASPVAGPASEQPLAASGVQAAAKGPGQLTEGVQLAEKQAQSVQQTSESGSQKGPQHKRRPQPSSSITAGQPSKRRCVMTRSSQGGQVQPLLTAPTDVTWQDKKGLYETSRRGRVRYPPLAFWMQETKVHDKHGGAVAIQRPAASPAPSIHPKPPPHTAPSQPARSHSKAQPGAQSQRPAASVSKSHAQSKPMPQEKHAEAQSQMQTEESLPAKNATSSKNAGKQAQCSTKRRAISPEAAADEPPVDPPSPPFPYPILAKRAPQADRALPACGGSKHQTVHKLPPAVQAQSRKEAAGKAIADQRTDRKRVAAASGQDALHKAKGKRSVAHKAPADVTDQTAVVRGSSKDEAEAGPSSAMHVAAAATGSDQPLEDIDKGSAKMKRCGTCKNCLQKQSKKGCLFLRVLREQAQAAQDAQQPESKSEPASQQVKSTKPAAKTSAVQQVTQDAQAKPTSRPAAGAAPAQAGKEASKGNKPGTKPPSSRGSKKNAAGRADKGGVAPEGSIHSALTHAVELASDMEQPEAAEQQQQAAQVLESLKHSPMKPARPHPADSGPVAAAPGQSAAPPEASHEEAAAAEPSPAKRGRGRPRKERKPGEEEQLLASPGPKRGRGRPRKSPLQPAAQALDGSGATPLDSVSMAVLLVNAEVGTSGTQDAAQVKVKLEKDQHKVATARQTKGTKGKPAQAPSATAPQPNRGITQQPSTSGSAPAPIEGWTTEQRAALQRAYLTVKPSQRNFWQHVAKLVPGKTALECCNCKFDELPTPVEKAKQTSRLLPDRGSSPIRPPALKVTGGRVKKPTVAATKQWARQVRWQQRAQEQSDDDSPQAPPHPAAHNQARSNLGNPQRSSATSSLLAAIRKQDKADKYIDRILRKQGGRLHKFKAAPVPSATAAGAQAKAKQHQHNQQATTGVMAGLQALNRRQPPMDDMYESEQDHYFSGDDDEDA